MLFDQMTKTLLREKVVFLGETKIGFIFYTTKRRVSHP